MSGIDFLASEIFSRFGSVKRAKKCFLYTAKGIRLVDMFQENGRAILGWEGGSAFTMLKNALSRGIAGSFETDFPYRTKKAVQALFSSEREIFIYYSKEEALKASLAISPAGTNFFRPWNSAEISWSEIDSIVFAPPLPWAEPLFFVAAKPACVKAAFERGAVFAAGKKLPAPLHAAVARSIYNLISALQERSEKDWFVYDKILLKYWERKGPYLFPKIPEKNYNDFVIHCLKCGLVVNPDFSSPSIVPFGADAGVFTKLKNNPFEVLQ